MKTISRIGVMSLAKVQAAITGVMYFILAVALQILGKLQPDFAAQAGVASGVKGIITITLSGIAGGFVLGLLVAGLYNLLAPKIGGLQVELK